MSKAVIASGKQGNYWGMSSLLYENRPRNAKKMKSVVEKAGLDYEQFMKDFLSEETHKDLMDDVNNAIQLNLDATPTIYVNDEMVVGVKPYYKLKKILETHGAKRK